MGGAKPLPKRYSFLPDEGISEERATSSCTGGSDRAFVVLACKACEFISTRRFRLVLSQLVKRIGVSPRKGPHLLVQEVRTVLAMCQYRTARLFVHQRLRNLPRAIWFVRYINASPRKGRYLLVQEVRIVLSLYLQPRMLLQK